MYILPESLQAFRSYNQFILWQKSTDPRTGKIIKKPVNYKTLRVDSAMNPECWTSIEVANVTALQDPSLGVGFVFTANDPFFFFDIDGAYDGTQWSQAATDFCAQFQGAAVEVSVSGTGLHIFGTGKCPPHSCKNIQHGLELYTQDRFVALGKPETVVGDCSLDCTQALSVLVPSYFAANTEPVSNQQWTTTPRDEWGGHTDDDALIAAMCRVAATPWGEVASTGKATANDLWNNNTQVLALAYPADGRDYDASSADAALLLHLAYWTGCNCERMQTLMLRSGLVREKWTKHRSYLRMSITNAAQFQKNVHVLTPTKVTVSTQLIPTAEGAREGYQYMPVGNQIEYFQECTYIINQGCVLVENGSKLKPDIFKASFGGYDFQMATANDKTVDDAFKVFTQSQAYNFRKVDDVCFDPRHSFNEILNHDGLRLVNEYRDPCVESKQGDVQPFLTHLAKVLPDQHDQDILISYMAAVVQYKGVKFQWAPLLQGVEGNGKTLFTRCITEAVSHKYTHMLDAHDITNKFNAWMYGNIFIGVEDIKVSESQVSVIEKLKPMITNEYMPMQAKGVDQTVSRVCCNFLFNSNHKTAIRKNKNDRRFCIFYTAQQESTDLQRDGMTGDYFPNLYKWLRSDGYAAVTHYLQNYAITDALNPAIDCNRAPETSTTNEALNESLGSIEQEVIEACDSGVPGFCGGWVSSIALDNLLREKHIRMSRNRRGDMLKALGYERHKALPRGRTTRVTSIDHGKPRLYVLSSNVIAASINDSELATTAYIQAQTQANTEIAHEIFHS